MRRFSCICRRACVPRVMLMLSRAVASFLQHLPGRPWHLDLHIPLEDVVAKDGPLFQLRLKGWARCAFLP